MSTNVQAFLDGLPPLGPDANEQEQTERAILLNLWTPRTSDPKSVEQWNALTPLQVSESDTHIQARYADHILKRDGTVTDDTSTLDTTFRQGEVGARLAAHAFLFAEESDDDPRVVQYLPCATEPQG